MGRAQRPTPTQCRIADGLPAGPGAILGPTSSLRILVTPRSPFFHPVILTGIVINIVLLAFGFIALGSGEAYIEHLTVEDGLIEWMQFLSFVALSGLLAFLAVDRYLRHGGFKLDVLTLIFLSVLVAGAAGEEISWFQRVLLLDSPEFFLDNNRQSEMNLHNLTVGGVNLHKQILLKVIFIVGITHNLILPLLARRMPAVQAWVEKLGLYLPPLSASVIYLVLVIISQVAIDTPRKGEFGEAFGAVHYLSTVFAAYAAGVGYGQPATFANGPDRTRVSMLFAMFMVFLVLVSWILGAGYLSQPSR